MIEIDESIDMAFASIAEIDEGQEVTDSCILRFYQRNSSFPLGNGACKHGEALHLNKNA